LSDGPKTKVTRGKQRVDELGPYRLRSVLGSGGFGTVYAAEGPDGAKVAVKVLAPHMMTSELVRRFQREGDIRIEHPNVVRVLDAGTGADGTPYIAFELLEGEGLNERLRKAPLPPQDVIDIALQICAGLSAAHGRAIVHRDLKPGNVYLCQDGRTKVLDFGIARATLPNEQQLTMAGSVVGTPGYLAPEQARGEREVDARADLWALGVILYEALSGVAPFLRDSAVATILAVVLEDPAPLATKSPPLPRGLAEIVHRCLEKNLDKRWASADDVARALRAIDVATAAAAAAPEPVSVPDDEQRVMALVLAEGVLDRDALERVIESWGGELIPMLGFRAIGVFGRSTWEGDEAQRAVSAALEARDAVQWIAVASGRATGRGGTIAGDAVLAVERAAAAQLPGVAVAVTASRDLAQLFELRRAEGDLLEVPRGSQRRGSMGSIPPEADTPLLGREAELAQLDVAATAALDEPRATPVWVTGPAGIGKTRLRQELEKRLRARTPRVTVLSGRAESHRRDAAYHLVASALRNAPGLDDALSSAGVGVDLRRSAIERFCRGYLPEAQAIECAEAVSDLLGVPWTTEITPGRRSDPQLRADRVRLALSDLLLAMCERHPLALVLDDVQWADDASLALVADLCDRAGDRPLLAAIFGRPELDERERDRFGVDVVRIEPRGLRPAHVATLAASIAGRDVDEPLVRTITDRTGGNPFFVEQIVGELAEQNMLDRPPAQLPIPLHVEGAVQSRLDHLPPAEKTLCKIAAVLGRPFGARALAALGVADAEPLLVSLARRGLLTGRGTAGRDARDEAPSGVRRAIVEGAAQKEREYQFKNALVADVAYRMNAERARQELHSRAAAFLAGDPGVDSEEIARHHELGGATDEAAAFYAHAARAAQRRGDSLSVLRVSEKAIVLGVDLLTRFELHLARADALSFLGKRDEQARELENALRAAREPAERARALTEKCALLATLGQNDEGASVGEDAVRAAREVGDSDLLATALVRLGWVRLYSGRMPEASAAVGEAARMTQSLSPEVAALVAAWKAQLATALGDLGQRKTAYEEAVARYREVGDLRRAASVESNLADTLNRVGAYDAAERALRVALENSRRVGNRVVEGFALANLGYALSKLERTDEALDALLEAERIGLSAKQNRLVLASRLYRARTLLGHRDPETVVREAEAVADQARRAGAIPWCISALAVAAEARLLAGDADAALHLSTRAMTLRDEIGAMEEDESEVFLAHARALRANGKETEAKEALALGFTRLEFLAGRIGDGDWRARFLSDVPANRALIELAGAL
jgi:tetratricopeptide (TPR) repeat protein